MRHGPAPALQGTTGEATTPRLHARALTAGLVSGDPLTPAGEVRAAGKVRRVRFVAGQLWVLSRNQHRMEIFDVTDPAAPVRLGAVTSGAAQAFRARWAGPYSFTFSGHVLRVRRAVRVAP